MGVEVSRGEKTQWIKDRHIVTKVNLEVIVSHRMKPEYGKTLVIHREEKRATCGICRAIGFNGTEGSDGAEAGDREN